MKLRLILSVILAFLLSASATASAALRVLAC